MESVEEIWKRLPYATILSEEGSREVLEEMANPPEDSPERRRMFERVRYMRALRQRQAEQDAWGVEIDLFRAPTGESVRLQITDAGVVIPREMLPNVREVDVRREGHVMVLTPLPDPNDAIWDLADHAVECGLPDASENHDHYIYGSDAQSPVLDADRLHCDERG